MLNSSFASTVSPALISRTTTRPEDPGQYLLITPDGAAHWTQDPRAATAFVSMKEAIREASHLPASIRAFSLPLDVELLALAELN
jgi:hypothetical protein